MNEKDIFKLAEKAGAAYFPERHTLVVHGKYGSGDGMEFVKKFANLIAEAERGRLRQAWSTQLAGTVMSKYASKAECEAARAALRNAMLDVVASNGA